MHRPSFVCFHLGDEGGSAFYRVLTPLLTARQNGLIQIRTPDKMQFFPKELLEIMRPDTVLFHRSHTANQIKYMDDVMKSIDSMKIYTIDDWVGKVPKESPHYKDIPKGIDKDIKKAIDKCDKLIVTTDTLANVYGYKKDTYIIPNYLSETIWAPIYLAPKRKPDIKATPRIGWSGGIGHPGDLRILREIADILGDKVRWVFLGDMPAGFDQGNSEVHQPVPVTQYSHALYSLNLDLALAPLLDNDFNRGKSNLRILEYGACSFPVIASNVKTYQGLPVTFIEYNAKWWAEAIMQKLDNREALIKEGDELAKYVWENYKLDDHIEIYGDILSPDGKCFIPAKDKIEPDIIDVLITTHDKKDLVERCVNSVIESVPHNKTPINIIVSDNASTEIGFREYLHTLRDKGITVIERDLDEGYIVNINGACQVNLDHDVVTLNSDTIVNGDWIDRFKNLAYSNEKIASVTPFTNNGSIVSYPNPQGGITSPALVKFYDMVASEIGPSDNYILPTSVGFCTYIKRSVLNEIGLFDEHAFGRGYAEENDWSLRALEKGYINVLAPNIYVGHDHGATFGKDKPQLLEKAAHTLSIRWQQYPKLVQQWAEAGILNALRERFDTETIAKTATEPKTLYIAHGFGGGLETYLQSQIQKNSHAIILRNDPSQSDKITIEVPGENYYNLPVINPRLSSLEYIKDTFLKFKISHIYVQTTFGYSYTFPLWIENLATLMGIDYSVMLHDYLTVCPRLRMIQTVDYCGEPEVEECNKCVMHYGSAMGQLDVGDYRAMYTRFLKNAQRVFAPSYDLANRLEKYFDPQEIDIEVVPHEVDVRIKESVGHKLYEAGESMRVAVIGSITPDKGSLIIRDCAKYCEDNSIPMMFLVFGNLIDNSAGFRMIPQTPNLRIFNTYQEENLRSMLEQTPCHVSFFPALWPETYSYTLSHAFRAGLFPVCYDIGAIAERIKDKSFGKILPFEMHNSISETVAALQTIIKEIVNDAISMV